MLVALALACALGAVVVASMTLAPALLDIVENPDQFRIWVDEHGVLSRLTMIGFMMLKVILPFIPGKPLEIGAGYAFGAFEGTLLCIIGAALGSYIVFGIVRTVGVRAFNVFYPHEKLLQLSFLKDTKRLGVWIFFIMLIPGTPKDFLSYFVGLTDIKFRNWALISPLARIPVIVMATVGGDALGTQNYGFALLIFSLSIAISAVGILSYNYFSKRKRKG